MEVACRGVEPVWRDPRGIAISGIHRESHQSHDAAVSSRLDFFLIGLAAWTADAFNFHALSIHTVKLADYYDRTKMDVSTAITLTLLLRSVGAVSFGLAGGKYGRKLVLNMIVLGALQIATIYSRMFQEFLAVRGLFGLFTSGVYRNAIAMAREHCS